MTTAGSPSAGSTSAAEPGVLAESRRWKAPAAVLGIALAVAVLCWPTAQSLVREWTDANSVYRHAFLLLLVAAWLAMSAARGLEPRPEPRVWLPLVLLGGASFAWLVAWRAGIQVAHQAMLPVLMLLAVWSALGQRIARVTAVPIALLYSVLPVWHLALPALQWMTVRVCGALLQVFGIPAFVEGDYVHIRSGVFHVEDGCAGLHFFIVAVSMAAIYGEVRGDRPRVRIALLALGVVLALVSNWLRVFIVVVAGHLTDMQHYLVRVDHYKFGWALFAVSMIGFVLLGRLWRHAELPPAPAPEAGIAPRRFALAIAGALAFAAAGPAWSALLPVRAAASPNVVLPASLAGWSGPGEFCRGHWRPEFATADVLQSREFVRGDTRLCMFLASYLSQRQDKELIGYSTSVTGHRLAVVAAAAREAAGRGVEELRLEDESADRLVWYSYAIGAHETRRGFDAQLRYAFGTLFGAPASSVVAMSAACVPDCAAARQVLAEAWPRTEVIGNVQSRVESGQ